MAFSLRNYVKNYFKKQKTFSIITDFLFVVFIVLLIIPGTRKEVSSFLIRMVSLPPSELSSEDQFMINQEIGFKIDIKSTADIKHKFKLATLVYFSLNGFN